MSKKQQNPGIIVLPSDSKDNQPLFGNTISIKDLLSADSSESMGEVGELYNYVSSPNIHIKDKVNALLKLHMFFSKEVLTNESLDWEAVQVYRVRKEAVADLKRMIEILNEYSAMDNFDIEHPLYNKSLSFIIEALLTSVKANTEGSQFDHIVRDVAIALPSIEARVRNMIQDSSTEDILALRDNPILDAVKGEKELFLEYVKNRDSFIEYINTLKK